MNKVNLIAMMKKYGYYCLAGVLTVGLALIVSLSLGTGSATVPEQNVPVGTTDLNFISPMENASVIKNYSDTELQYNKTLNQWEAHFAVDLASEQSSVYSVLSGVVSSVNKAYETGTEIKITHDNGFVSVYSSLNENVDVKQGDKVAKGQKIAEIADSSSRESLEGKHLHFELYKDGTKVDPSNYITFEQK